MIEYRTATGDLEAGQLAGFFEGWPDPPSPETHLRILGGSAAVVLAVDEETGRVVGFINAISDGVLSAFIPLLEVLPSHRGQGIGSELVRRMLDRLSDLYGVDLVCDESLRPFYERLGMKPLVGMVHRNFEAQAGRGG